MKKLCLLCAVLLSGCGGGSGDGAYGSDHGGGGSGVKADAFFAQVDKLVASAPEDTEPVAVDAVALTSPDDTEAATL